jgi:hypothetical protein
MQDKAKSAFAHITDLNQTSRHDRKVPQADICSAAKNTRSFDCAIASFDDLACGNLQRHRNCEAEGLCSLQIDDSFELDRHLNG